MAALNLGEGKRIESPISAFNNILQQITKKLIKIYLPGKDLSEEVTSFTNNLVFGQNSITISNCIKLVLMQEKIGIQYLGIFTDMSMVSKTIDNQRSLKELFQNYIYMISTIGDNYDDSVSQKHVETIFELIKSNRIDSNQLYILPYKNKIKHLYDANDKVMEKLYNQYSYVIKFDCITKNHFSYKLMRVTSSILNEAKSLENIRFEDIETLKSESVAMRQLQQFLIDLFYYGDIK